MKRMEYKRPERIKCDRCVCTLRPKHTFVRINDSAPTEYSGILIIYVIVRQFCATVHCRKGTCARQSALIATRKMFLLYVWHSQLNRNQWRHSNSLDVTIFTFSSLHNFVWSWFVTLNEHTRDTNRWANRWIENLKYVRACSVYALTEQSACERNYRNIQEMSRKFSLTSRSLTQNNWTRHSNVAIYYAKIAFLIHVR